MHIRAAPLHVAATFVAIACFLTLTAGAPGAVPDRPFSPQSFWNKPLSRTERLHPQSRAMVRRLIHQKDTYGPWINTTQYSTPVYTVPPGQPTVSVRIDSGTPMYTNAADAAALEQSLATVPIPPGARPAAGTDAQIVIWQPSTDTIWELWIARHVTQNCLVFCGPRDTPGWHAAWGARLDHVSRHSGRVPAPYGATATGLPLLGGLMRIRELQAGRIGHALAVSLPETSLNQFVWPATRSDGNSSSPDAIPEGTRFRLDPRLRLNRLGLPPVTLAMARAAKRYGIVVADKSAAVVFDAEDPTPRRRNPYVKLFGGQWPSSQLERFPWEHLQTLAPAPPRVKSP